MTNETECSTLSGHDFNVVDMFSLEGFAAEDREGLEPYLASIAPNNMVRLLFECADGHELIDVIVTGVDGDIITGIVDFVPEIVPLSWGETVVFGPHHITDLSLQDFSVRLSSVREITAAIKAACQPPETRPLGALAALEAAEANWIRKWRGAPFKDQPNDI